MQFDADRPISGEEFMISSEVMNSNQIERNRALMLQLQPTKGKKKMASQPRKRKNAAWQMVDAEAAKSVGHY